jgi:hypothetical protein
MHNNYFKIISILITDIINAPLLSQITKNQKENRNNIAKLNNP